MTLDQLREYCLSKQGTEESFPFDESTLVFKVLGKMFALVDIDQPDSINLKCDPEKAIDLRENYDDITPGFHMNKKHWNSVSLIGRLHDSFILSLIDHSYQEVVRSLPKKEQVKL